MPKVYSHEEREQIIEHTLEELAKGRSLSTICDEDHMACSYAQWMRWQGANEALRERVAHAREAGATKLLEEIIAIADGKDGIRGDANMRKVRIYAREKYAAMIAPHRFGMQRLDVTSGGKVLPQPIGVSTERIDALLAIAHQRALTAPVAEGEYIDVTPSPPSLSDLLD